MLKVAVLVSGGGTNLQAILDAIDNGTITNAKVEVVISNNKNAYALERAKNHGIEALCISPKDYGTRDAFNKAFLEKLDDCQPDLIVLAGFLVVKMCIRDRLRIVGPLGNGFPKKEKKAFLIGGGIGIPPMLQLAKRCV